MSTLTHAQIQASLKDATEEISRIETRTSWVSKGPAKYHILDEDKNILGFVCVYICPNACVEMTFQARTSTYKNIQKVAKISVDVANLTDAQEQQKIIDFDTAIADAFNL